jgi:hypothetical protein
MKTINYFKNAVVGKTAVVAVAVMTLFGACKKEPPKPDPTCDYTAHFEYDQYNNGYFGNYVIVLDNGTRINPCKVQSKSINPSEVYNGMEITVSYKVLASEECTCQFDGILPGGCVVYDCAEITCIEREAKAMWCGTR